MPNNPSTVRNSGLYERRRWVYAGLVVLLIATVVLYVLSQPVGSSLLEQGKTRDELRAQVKAKRENVAHLRQIEGGLSEANRTGQDFYNSKFLPAATGYGTVMEELEKLSQSTGVTKGAVGYSEAELKERPGVRSVDIGTTLEGDYPKIVKFINELEKSDLFLIVDSLGVGGGGPGKPVSLNLKLRTYFRGSKTVNAEAQGTR